MVVPWYCLQMIWRIIFVYCSTIEQFLIQVPSKVRQACIKNCSIVNKVKIIDIAITYLIKKKFEIDWFGVRLCSLIQDSMQLFVFFKLLQPPERKSVSHATPAAAATPSTTASSWSTTPKSTTSGSAVPKTTSKFFRQIALFFVDFSDFTNFLQHLPIPYHQKRQL